MAPSPARNAVIAGALLVVLFVGSISVVLLTNLNSEEGSTELAWWQKTLIYHIYVPSFKDSNGDGMGDLKGIEEKLEYIKELGFDSIWLSPIYEDGGLDMGNDVKNHRNVDEKFGTNEDLQDLLKAVDRLGMKVILDFIPNHTSIKHEWFILSENKTGKYKDYYVWKDSPKDKVPNSWLNIAGKPAWKYSDIRKEWYLHNYLEEMPDLNLTNPDVVNEFKEIMDYYLQMPAVMGFHISGFNILIEIDSNVGENAVSDPEKTMTFLEELYNQTEIYASKDGLKRLLLLEMVDNFDNAEIFEGMYRNFTAGIATVPFSFHRFPTKLGHERNVTGDIIYREVYDYYFKESNAYDAWPAWEMNDYDTLQGSSRFPLDLANMFFMINLLLPGTGIIYYGDEIGMNNQNFTLKYEELKDPYTINPKYCSKAEYERGSCICRDASRTPMQWKNSTHADFTNFTEPWLPINPNYPTFNVENQKEFHLQSFRNISKLRQTNAFKYGWIYFPFHDENIFSYLRKDPDDEIAYLAVIHIQPNKDKTNDIHNYKTIDFTSAMPDFPLCGKLVASTDLTGVNQAHDHDITYGSRIPTWNVQLDPFEGFVLELDFGNADVECSEL